MAGWGTGGWGSMPWGGSIVADESYFLPPTVKVYPPPTHPSRQVGRLWWRFDWHRIGQENSDQQGMFKVGSTYYFGGRWNGPLTAAQITEIQAAGHGARIVTVEHPGQLPPGLDN